jgi:hypothetical protein
MFTKKNVSYEHLSLLLIQHDIAPSSIGLNEMLSRPEHSVWAYLTMLYGRILTGDTIAAAGGDVTYHFVSLPGVEPFLYSSVADLDGELISPLSVEEMLAEWLIAYHDDYSVRAL